MLIWNLKKSQSNQKSINLCSLPYREIRNRIIEGGLKSDYRIIYCIKKCSKRCWRVVLIADNGKRNISRSINQDERPKVVMVSSSEKDTVQTGPAVDSGLGHYTPPGPQSSGIDHNHEKGLLHQHVFSARISHGSNVCIDLKPVSFIYVCMLSLFAIKIPLFSMEKLISIT